MVTSKRDLLQENSFRIREKIYSFKSKVEEDFHCLMFIRSFVIASNQGRCPWLFCITFAGFEAAIKGHNKPA